MEPIEGTVDTYSNSIASTYNEGNDSRDRTKSPSPIPQNVEDSSMRSQAESQFTVRTRSGRISRPTQRLEFAM